MIREVLVVDANAIGMIAVLRSLGRADYKPHAVSVRLDALGFKSRYAYKCSVHPDYHSDAFLLWLRNYIAEHSIQAIVCGEELLDAIHDHYAEFESLIPDSPPGKVRRLCLSKVNVSQHLARDPATNRNVPHSGIFDNAESIDSFANSHVGDTIFYLKMDQQKGRAPGAVSSVARVGGIEGMREVATDFLQDYSALSWQEEVTGLQVGVSLWRNGNNIRAENMVLGQHLYPHHAGNMSLRKTWWHEEILADAKTKLAALDWTGVAMMEYIWNPESDKFWFIELNPRFWGYLHLDLACGKDFPRWQMDAHFGLQTEGLGPPRISRTMRYAPGEVIHVASRCLAPSISIYKKLRSIVDFVVLGLSPKVQADLWFSGDKMMYVHGWIRFVRELPERITKIFQRRT